MIEAEPDGPAMMIKGDREQQRCNEKERQDKSIVRPDDGQANEIECQNHKLGSDYVHHDCADEESFLAIEHNPARTASILDSKRSLNNRSFAASRTAKTEATAESPDN
jgi:hypothetical protein